MPDHFRYAPADARLLPLLTLLRVDPERDGVEIADDGTVRMSFGLFTAETALDNVVAAEVTGPYRWWKAGGLRLSLADGGLTFGTAGTRGVCLRFRDPVGPVVVPWRHKGITVTVAAPDTLVAEIERRQTSAP